MKYKRCPGCQRGQVILMCTVGLVVLFGMMALAVDLGWSYYLRKYAQRAADAASLAGAIQVLDSVGNATPTCGTNVTCQATPTGCPSSISNPPQTEIDVACLYAQQNGFTAGGKNGTQNVTIASGTTTPPPTVPGVNSIYYWITVRVTQKSPIWFGNVIAESSRGLSETQSASGAWKSLPVALWLIGGGGPAARATAGVATGILGGTVWLLNRQNDSNGYDGNTGEDLGGGGSVSVTAPGGIYMASTDNGSNGVYAGSLQGTPSVTAPFTDIRGAGTVHLGGNASWTAAPTNGFPDGAMFYDPMGGKGQPPPLPSGGLTNYVGVANGCLDCLVQPLKPGQYYSVDSKGNPTGQQLTANSDVTFSDNGTGFANYVFYGGLAFPSTHTTATFSPGRYVLAGAPSGSDILSYHTQVTLQDLGTAGMQNTDAGEIFIFTDPTYPGLAGNYPPALAAKPSVLSSLTLSDVNLQAGNNPSIGINFHGLNVESANVPADLKPFAPAVFWQDQRNSYVKYDSNGNIDTTSCGSGHSLDNPCTTTLKTSGSSAPGMTLQAHPNTSLYGLVYQPRGAWMTFQGHGSISSATMFVTGALNLQGGASLQMINSRDALKKRMVVLIE